ncbi:glycosyltransferase [Butyricimonas sp. Marseille-P3923]|uniref:glycosyltransferase n=1 Tax=Butyricimonas sp. Marseille-P3923 TaxID=1987504 RepID=UPI000C07F676|nr:glycosyltransferase [Butyricimonas sp. Marseille-P3923]
MLSKNRRVLILADAFPPEFAPRVGYLAKYMLQFGWEGDVLTEYKKGKYDFDHLVGHLPVRTIQLDRLRVSTLEKGFRYFKRVLFGWDKKDFLLHKEGEKMLNKHKYDVIFCTTSTLFPLITACKLARKYDLPLIADFRDIYEQYKQAHKKSIHHFVEKIIEVNRRNRILKKIDAVISVSPWHQEYLKRYNKNSFLIYNGFDPEIFYYRPLQETGIFTVTYTGTICHFDFVDVEPLGMLFQAISKLVVNNVIYKGQFRVQFFTDDLSAKAIIELVNSYNIADFIEINSWIRSSQVPEYLAASNILLVLLFTNKTKGILTTKLFEYLAMGRDILCIPYSEPVRKILDEMQVGLSTNTVEDIYHFLFDRYEKWKNNKAVELIVNSDMINKYSRKEQAKQFVEIFNNVLENKKAIK